MGFFDIPRRRLPPVALSGVIALLVVWFVPMTGPGIALGLTLASVPSTYDSVRNNAGFDYESFSEDSATGAIGWVLAVTVVTGAAAVAVGAILQPFAVTLPDSLALLVVLALTGSIPYFLGWRLIYRLNDEYRTNKPSSSR